ncbi:MAG: 30S ribosomal protein S2 [Acidobacteria bacterium]|nr:30S ribosomal protein S2 [Acidobacteriota bacterium]
MVDISMKELLEAGVHFGHQTRRWNPKMKKYIFGSRNGIYIIDLQKTMKLFRETASFITDSATKGKNVLFVGTKRQAQESIESVGQYGIPFVNQRWLGGTLTNFSTIKKSIDKLNDLEKLLESEEIEHYSKKDRYGLERKRIKLMKLFRGLKELKKVPDIMFVIDPRREKIAVQEARIMNVPVVAVVDTNCDPDVIDWVIPGNDDAIRAIKLFVNKMVQAIKEGQDIAGINQEAAEEALAAEGAGFEPEAVAEKPKPKPEAKLEPKAAVKPEPKTEAKPKAAPKVEKTVEPKAEKKAEAEPKAVPKAAPKAAPKVEKAVEPKAEEPKAKLKTVSKAKKVAEPKAEKKAVETKSTAKPVEKVKKEAKSKAAPKKKTVKAETTKKAEKKEVKKPKAAVKKTTKAKAEKKPTEKAAPKAKKQAAAQKEEKKEK